MKNAYPYQTPAGEIWITEQNGVVCRLDFGREPHDYIKCETPILREAHRQLMEYFDGTRTKFDVPLRAEGTPFQQKVWNALCDIPYGETRSYKQIAEAVKSPAACRAVGMANNRNPISIFIPCHRVIGADGKMVGYGGGIDKKVFLLELENRGR